MVGRPEYLYIAVARDGRPHLPHGGHAGSGGNWPSVVLDAKKVLFSQQLI
jgi:hypothetical protein